MNYLFSSAVFALAVTVGVPGWAQTSTSPYLPSSSQPTPFYTQSAPSSEPEPTHSRLRYTHNKVPRKHLARLLLRRRTLRRRTP